jgi:hypothetical protein
MRREPPVGSTLRSSPPADCSSPALDPEWLNGSGGESAGWPRADPLARGVIRPRNVRTPQDRMLGNAQSG